MSDKAVRDVMQSRGWKRTSRPTEEGRHGLIAAPCSRCGEIYDVDRYPIRECQACRMDADIIREKLAAGEELTLREERVLSLERTGR